MGIKNFAALSKKYPIEKQQWLSDFAGYRIAIDLPFFLMSRAFVAQKKVLSSTDIGLFGLDRREIMKILVNMTLDFAIVFLEAGIIPVFVADGTSPVEKTKVRAERRAKQQKIIDEIATLTEELKQFDILSKPPEKVKRLKELYSQRNFLTSEESESVRNTLINVGIPVLVSTTEGEKLCSNLCRAGLVAAVYSKDTDCFAFGAPLVIKDIQARQLNKELVKYDRPVTCVYLEDMLRAVELNHESFVDLCIMAGCDFNENIPRIGIIKSFNLLKECKSIDSLPQGLKKDCLNHIVCRDIFKIEDPLKMIESGTLEIALTSEIRDALDVFDASEMTDKLIQLIDAVGQKVLIKEECNLNTLHKPRIIIDIIEKKET